MTRINFELNEAYDAAKDGKCGPQMQKIADTADAAAGMVCDTFKDAAVAFPGDDRMMSIELQIFAAALNVAGIDPANLIGKD